MVDLNVMTKEPSIMPNGQEEMEILLAIDDMQSVISNNMTNDNAYTLKPRKRRVVNSLEEMYSSYENPSNKRFKASEDQCNDESGTTIYDMDDLYDYISQNDVRITFSTN